MEKQATIAATMRQFMATGPSVVDFPTYMALNDFVGKAHGLKAGKCQSLAGEKAWKWHADQATKTWRPATEAEFKAKQEAAAAKNSGGTRKAKVMTDAERAALDAQVTALEQVNNPALAGLLADLLARQAADDLARKGSLKDRLAAAIDRIGIEKVVDFLEQAIADYDAKVAAEAAAAEVVEDATENA